MIDNANNAHKMARRIAKRDVERSRSRAVRAKAYADIGKPAARDEHTNLIRFVCDLEAIRRAAVLQEYLVPTFSAESTERLVLTKKQTSVLLGAAPDTINIWIRRGWFPEPIGVRLIGMRSMGAYTVDEVIAFARILTIEMGSEPIDKPFNTNPHVPNLLFQASAVIRRSITHKAPLQWRTIAD